MDKPLWVESEDSFLKHFCKIQRNDATDYYCWDEGLMWPKFTFLRLKSPENLSLDQFLNEVKQFKNFSKVKDEDLVIKVNDKYSVPADLQARIQPTGSKLAYLRFDKVKKDPLPDCELHKVENISSLKIFWSINSSGRTRVNPFDSPLWPKVKKSFESGTQYYYLKHNGIPISCGAIDNLGEEINMWGVATVVDQHRKGYMGEVIRLMSIDSNRQCLGQVNYGGVSHLFLKKHCSVEQLATESWYKLK